MKFLEILNMIASIISIGGAVWSLRNLKKIKEIKSNISTLMNLEKYSSTSHSKRGTIELLKRIANHPTIPPGTDLSRITESINEHYANLIEIKEELYKDGYIDIAAHMNDLKDQLKKIQGMDKDSKEIATTYTEIYYKILAIDSRINEYKKKIILNN